MGSVKDLTILVPPTTTTLGVGDFTFSDRYSVFDWGEMPDPIPYKGAALCLMASWNFERLHQKGHSSHYLGLRGTDNHLVNLSELTSPSTSMTVSLSRVVKPSFERGLFDYSYFINERGETSTFVVPLEVIYRRGVPKGSSLLRTLSDLEREGRDEDMKILLTHYGLTAIPHAGDLLPRVGFDFTTKFESTDRPVSDEEAYRISGLTSEQFSQLRILRAAAVTLVGWRAQETGFVDYDGKHEYLLYNGRVYMADVFGTLDENRFMFNGIAVSKEFLRQVYRTTQPDWVNDVENSKRRAKEEEISDWKSLVTTRPEPLDPRLVDLVGEMYASAAERYTSLPLFGVRPLEEVLKDLEPYYPR